MFTITLATPSLSPEAGGPAYSVLAIGRNLGLRGVRTRYTIRHGADAVPAGAPCSLAGYRDSDLVHNFGLWTMLNHWASVSSRLARRPVVLSPLGMLEPWSLA